VVPHRFRVVIRRVVKRDFAFADDVEVDDRASGAAPDDAVVVVAVVPAGTELFGPLRGVRVTRKAGAGDGPGEDVGYQLLRDDQGGAPGSPRLRLRLQRGAAGSMGTCRRVARGSSR
jgi:hypothetical protein